MRGSFIFTSEAGLGGHPDKVADQIGDAVLDACLTEDPYSRIGCNVMVTRDLVLVGGQLKSNSQPNIENIVRSKIRDIGYIEPNCGFDYATCEVISRIDPQARTISNAVGSGGAGDSALMFGYACIDTPELMPLPVNLAHKIARTLDKFCKTNGGKGLGPDGKVQVSVKYEQYHPVHVDNFVISIQHEKEIDFEDQLERILRTHIIDEVIPKNLIQPATRLHIKPTLGFVVGGPKSDCGLSGRKVVADTYGGWARNGGGGLSGKDPTKIDRCGTYMARYIAKNIVASGIADRCEVQLAYMFGYDMPVSLFLDFHNTGKVEEEKVSCAVKKIFPLSVLDIIEELNLRRPIYQKVGLYGHFGNLDDEFTWEQTNKSDDLLSLI